MIKKSIADMLIGEAGIIANMDKVEIKSRHRFMDLGIAPNARVTLLKKINFNNLYIIDIDDVEICIRKADAKKIEVEM